MRKGGFRGIANRIGLWVQIYIYDEQYNCTGRGYEFGVNHFIRGLKVYQDVKKEAETTSSTSCVHVHTSLATVEYSEAPYTMLPHSAIQ